MRLVFGEDLYVAEWAAQRIKYLEHATDFGPGSTIGVADDNGNLVGAVIYHGYRDAFKSIEMSVASEGRRWLSRSVITSCFRYPFLQLACKRVTTYTPGRNKRALELLRGLGFRREGVMRRGCGNDDLIISGMLHSEWERSPFNLDRVERAREIA